MRIDGISNDFSIDVKCYFHCLEFFFYLECFVWKKETQQWINVCQMSMWGTKWKQAKTKPKKKLKKKFKQHLEKKKTREQTKLNGYGTDWNVNFSPGLYRKITANMTEEKEKKRMNKPTATTWTTATTTTTAAAMVAATTPTLTSTSLKSKMCDREANSLTTKRPRPSRFTIRYADRYTKHTANVLVVGCAVRFYFVYIFLLLLLYFSLALSLSFCCCSSTQFEISICFSLSLTHSPISFFC